MNNQTNFHPIVNQLTQDFIQKVQKLNLTFNHRNMINAQLLQQTFRQSFKPDLTKSEKHLLKNNSYLITDLKTNLKSPDVQGQLQQILDQFNPYQFYQILIDIIIVNFTPHGLLTITIGFDFKKSPTNNYFFDDIFQQPNVIDPYSKEIKELRSQHPDPEIALESLTKITNYYYLSRRYQETQTIQNLNSDMILVKNTLTTYICKCLQAKDIQTIFQHKS